MLKKISYYGRINGPNFPISIILEWANVVVKKPINEGKFSWRTKKAQRSLGLSHFAVRIARSNRQPSSKVMKWGISFTCITYTYIWYIYESSIFTLFSSNSNFWFPIRLLPLLLFYRASAASGAVLLALLLPNQPYFFCSSYSNFAVGIWMCLVREWKCFSRKSISSRAFFHSKSTNWVLS